MREGAVSLGRSDAVTWFRRAGRWLGGRARAAGERPGAPPETPGADDDGDGQVPRDAPLHDPTQRRRAEKTVTRPPAVPSRSTRGARGENARDSV